MYKTHLSCSFNELKTDSWGLGGRGGAGRGGFGQRDFGPPDTVMGTHRFFLCTDALLHNENLPRCGSAIF